MKKLFESENKETEVIECPPAKRTIFIDGPHHVLHVWFPYLVFGKKTLTTAHGDKLTILYLGFAKESVEENTRVYFPCLPNVYNDGRVCISRIPGGQFRLPSLIDCIDYFWKSSYGDVRQGLEDVPVNFCNI